MLFIVGSDMVFWTAIIDGYMRHGEMNRALEEFRGMQGRMGGIMRSPLFVLSINLIRICTPGRRLQCCIYLKDTKQLKNYIIIISGHHHHGIRSSLSPDQSNLCWNFYVWTYIINLIMS